MNINFGHSIVLQMDKHPDIPSEIWKPENKNTEQNDDEMKSVVRYNVITN